MVQTAPTVAVRALGPVVARLRGMGVDAEGFLARRGIDPALFADDEARVLLSKTEGLWEEAAELSGDDAFGLHLAESSQVSSFGLFSYLAVTSATWGVALTRVCNYFGLISDAAGYDVTEAKGCVTVRARPWPGLVLPRQVTEFSLGVLVCYGRRLLSEPLACTDVAFPHPKPASIEPHERIFRSRIRFAADSAEFSFERRFMDVPLISADSKLSVLLAPNALAELARIDSSASVTERLASVLPDAVRDGTPSLEFMARRLAMSPRTLQRQLAEEQTSFREQVGHAQSVVAGQLLTSAQLGVAEVAAVLGFSEPAAFHRSFKRWTGMTPTQYRQRHQEG